MNTQGTNADGVNAELIELLHYMERSTDEVSKSCKSDKIHQMHNRVNNIKSNEEIGVKFMQEWEEKIIEKQRARQEGLE